MKKTADIKTGRKYWGAMPLPPGAELLGAVSRDSQTGALIKMPTGLQVQGNAGVIRTLPADREDYQRAWEKLDTEVFKVLDDHGDNVADAKIRRCGDDWLYNDDVNGWDVLTDKEVSDLKKWGGFEKA